jgi:hypothetical protein
MVLTINNGKHEIMFIKAFVRVFKLAPSSFHTQLPCLTNQNEQLNISIVKPW